MDKRSLASSEITSNLEYISGSSQSVQSLSSSGYVQTIKIFGEIPEPDDERIIDILGTLETPGISTVNVVLNTYGGSWDTSIMLYSMLTAMSSTTFIKTIGISAVYSGGQIIYMAGAERLASYYTDFLIHISRISMQYESSTNSLNYVNKHLHTAKRVIQDIIGDYLTKEELNSICDASNDFYMNEIEAYERGIATVIGYVHPNDYLMLVEQKSNKDQEAFTRGKRKPNSGQSRGTDE